MFISSSNPTVLLESKILCSLSEDWFYSWSDIALTFSSLSFDWSNFLDDTFLWSITSNEACLRVPEYSLVSAKWFVLDFCRLDLNAIVGCILFNILSQS